MSTEAVATMAVIAGFVWGGFLTIAVTAFRKEKQKERDRSSAA